MLKAIDRYEQRSPVEIRFQTVKDDPFHWHNSIEVILVLEGSISVSIIDDTKPVAKGGVEIINLNQTHRLSSASEDNLVLIMQIDAEFARRCCPELEKVWLSHAFSPCLAVAEDHLQSLIRSICQITLSKHSAKEKSEPGYMEEVAAFVKAMIDTFDVIRNQRGDRPVQAARIRRVFDYLYSNTNFINKITLQDISVHADEYLNLDYLSALFRFCAGDSFQNILHYFRIDYSVKQLLSTDKKISDIAFECGYSAPRYFYKHFNALFPEGPRAFRLKYKGKLTEGSIDCFDPVPSERAIEKLREFVNTPREQEGKAKADRISVFLFELEDPIRWNDQGADHLFQAEKLWYREEKIRFGETLAAVPPDRILIHGLFAQERSDPPETENRERRYDWERANHLIRFLQDSQLKPVFIADCNPLYFKQ